ncbi:hypothetical protein F5Y16DRAFT_25329 [Xylariaceae sp. FL0255]|nr:hypothetical protein F5Y16DRAFT_25329 [Xylariaceae sp. FL0255]
MLKRASSTSSSKSRRDDGLHVLASPTEPQMDVIAIHGLNGNAHRTWTHETPQQRGQNPRAASSTMWLRDLLPSRLPNARIMTYGYNASVFTASKLDLFQDAVELLQQIQDRRRDATHPILFIAHSLGGLVLKRVRAPTLPIINGTPHRGSSLASPALVLAGILRASGLPIAKQRLKALQVHSNSLFDLTNNFRRLTSGISILSFYETKPTPPLASLVVQKDSAFLGLADETIVPLDANHRDICRFPDDKEGGLFYQVAQQLDILIENMRAKGLLPFLLLPSFRYPADCAVI